METQAGRGANLSGSQRGAHKPEMFHQNLFLDLWKTWEDLKNSKEDPRTISVEAFWGTATGKLDLQNAKQAPAEFMLHKREYEDIRKLEKTGLFKWIATTHMVAAEEKHWESLGKTHPLMYLRGLRQPYYAYFESWEKENCPYTNVDGLEIDGTTKIPDIIDLTQERVTRSVARNYRENGDVKVPITNMSFTLKRKSRADEPKNPHAPPAAARATAMAQAAKEARLEGMLEDITNQQSSQQSQADRSQNPRPASNAVSFSSQQLPPGQQSLPSLPNQRPLPSELGQKPLPAFNSSSINDENASIAPQTPAGQRPVPTPAAPMSHRFFPTERAAQDEVRQAEPRSRLSQEWETDDLGDVNMTDVSPEPELLKSMGNMSMGNKQGQSQAAQNALPPVSRTQQALSSSAPLPNSAPPPAKPVLRLGAANPLPMLPIPTAQSAAGSNAAPRSQPASQARPADQYYQPSANIRRGNGAPNFTTNSPPANQPRNAMPKLGPSSTYAASGSQLPRSSPAAGPPKSSVPPPSAPRAAAASNGAPPNKAPSNGQVPNKPQPTAQQHQAPNNPQGGFVPPRRPQNPPFTPSPPGNPPSSDHSSNPISMGSSGVSPIPCRISALLAEFNNLSKVSPTTLEAVIAMATAKGLALPPSHSMHVKVMQTLTAERFLTKQGMAVLSKCFDVDAGLCSRYLAMGSGKHAESMRANWMHGHLKSYWKGKWEEVWVEGLVEVWEGNGGGGGENKE